MSKIKLFALLSAVSMALSSCASIKTVSDNNAESMINMSVKNQLPYYETEKIEISDKEFSVAGISDGEIILNKYQWKYKLNCYLADSPEQVSDFPFDLSGLFSFKERDGHIYCYGFDTSDNYKTAVFSTDLNELYEIPDKDMTVNCIAPYNSDNILICSGDEKRTYFNLFNESGENIQSKDYDNAYFDAQNRMYQGDITFTGNGNIYFLYSNDIGSKLCKINDSFDIVADIPCEYFYNMTFFGTGENIYVCDSETEENVYSFFRINENTDSLEYAGTINGVDRIIPGTDGYDCYYYIDDEMYGFRIEENISDLIGKNIYADYVWLDNGKMYLASSENMFLNEIYGMSQEGNLRQISKLEETSPTVCDKISFSEHIQSVINNDDGAGIYDINLVSGESYKINISTEENIGITDILVNKSDILISYNDIETGYSGLLLYDKEGNIKTSVSDDILITKILTMNDGGFLIIIYDEESDIISPAIIKEGSNTITPFEFEGLGNSENIEYCFSDFEKNAVYIMSDKYIYSGIPENDKIYLEKIIDIENSELESCNSVREFYADSGNYYVRNENGLFVLRESETKNKKEIGELKILCIDNIKNESIETLYENMYPEIKISCINLNSAEEDVNERINMMLSKGEIPDIVISRDSEFSTFSIIRDNDKNAYADLYTLIENDPDTDVSDFQKNILQSMEHDGHLYQITPTFTLKTVLADCEKYIFSEGWSISDFTDFLNSRRSDAFLAVDIDEVSEAALNLMTFYDYDKSKAYFNTDDFKKLMEMLKVLPDVGDRNKEFALYNAELINYSDENYIRKCCFGGRDIVNAGCPGIGGNGVLINPDIQFSVYNESSHKSEAWNYIKLYLTEEYFLENYGRGFPVRKSLLDKYADDARHPDTEDEFALIGYDLNKNPVNIGIPDNDSVFFIQSLIDGASNIYRTDSRIYSVFNENFYEYIDGQMNVEEFAEKIQKKAEIYLGER